MLSAAGSQQGTYSGLSPIPEGTHLPPSAPTEQTPRTALEPQEMPLPDLQPSTQQKERRSSYGRIAAEWSQFKGENRVKASKQCKLDGQEPSLRGERLWRETYSPKLSWQQDFSSSSRRKGTFRSSISHPLTVSKDCQEGQEILFFIS